MRSDIVSYLYNRQQSYHVAFDRNMPFIGIIDGFETDVLLIFEKPW